MTRNPFYNALFAIAYIVVLVSCAILGPQLLNAPQQSLFYPMLALAVFVLSAALMTYLFFYQPVIMLLDGEREKAVKLFLQTVGIFGVATVALLLIAVLVNA